MIRSPIIFMIRSYIILLNNKKKIKDMQKNLISLNKPVQVSSGEKKEYLTNGKGGEEWCTWAETAWIIIDL